MAHGIFLSLSSFAFSFFLFYFFCILLRFDGGNAWKSLIEKQTFVPKTKNNAKRFVGTSFYYCSQPVGELLGFPLWGEGTVWEDIIFLLFFLAFHGFNAFVHSTIALQFLFFFYFFFFCLLAYAWCSVSGSPVTCNDHNSCTDDVCLPENGKCSFTALSCDDFNACTLDHCDPITGCSYAPIVCGTCSFFLFISLSPFPISFPLPFPPFPPIPFPTFPFHSFSTIFVLASVSCFFASRLTFS